jgi:hypothetical protein
MSAELDGIEVFVTVAEAKGFCAAGEQRDQFRNYSPSIESSVPYEQSPA